MRIRFASKKGQSALMYISPYGKKFVNISNFKEWRKYDKRGTVAETAVGLLSHESLHMALNKVSDRTSSKLDEFFGHCSYWDKYSHGLGNFYTLG
jgi:hypothetical protein